METRLPSPRDRIFTSQRVISANHTSWPRLVVLYPGYVFLRTGGGFALTILNLAMVLPPSGRSRATDRACDNCFLAGVPFHMSVVGTGLPTGGISYFRVFATAGTACGRWRRNHRGSVE